jgi:hypothetical protein
MSDDKWNELKVVPLGYMDLDEVIDKRVKEIFANTNSFNSDVLLTQIIFELRDLKEMLKND